MSLVTGYSSSEESENEKVTNPVTANDSTVLVHGKPVSHTNATGISLSTMHMDEATFEEFSSKRVHKSTKSERKALKAKRKKLNDPSSELFMGSWAPLSSEEEDEVPVNVPVQESESEPEEDVFEPSSELYAKLDYQGRTYMHIPQDVDIDMKKEPMSWECFMPKKRIHTFSGHSNGTTKLKMFPNTGHLLLSAGNDGNIFLWDMYHEYGKLRGFFGHRKSVRDVDFDKTGEQFASVGYDRLFNIWNTETGSVTQSISLNSVPNCVQFHPNENQALVGLTNAKILHYDLRVGKEPVQTYDHHLSLIMSLCYYPDGSKFISSSEDKSIRIWDNQVNVPIKMISDTTQHAMPHIHWHPQGQQFAAQSMDSTIYTFSTEGRYRRGKKIFRGHDVAGHNIDFGFSPDGKYVTSGDRKGKVFIWDWNTSRLVSKLNVDTKAITNVVWNPQDTSKVVCSGSSGKIYLYD